MNKFAFASVAVFANRGRYLLVSLLCLTLLACGFHLRGSLSLSADMAPLYLQQNNVFELAREIKDMLSSNKISMTENVEQARTRLTLISENRESRVLSVDGSGQAQEYLLLYTVNISMQTADSEEVSDSVLVRRDLVFDSAAVLGFANEAEVLYKDMRKQAARQVLLKLQAFSRQQAAAPASIDKGSDNRGLDDSAASDR